MSRAGNALVNQARDPHLPPARSQVLPVLPPATASTPLLSLPHASPQATSPQVLPHRPQRQEQ